ncbi:MAG: diaminopimelate decarboxylase [Fidelibacterota bacterium]
MADALTHPLGHLIMNKDLLESLAETHSTPLYVYDRNRLRDNVIRLDRALSESFKNYTICYALKANTNPHLIAEMRSAVPTLGADCSSPGELYLAQEVGIPPESCLYTGNYESERELRLALDSGVHLNLDDATSYERLRRIGLPPEISFRLNPGFGKGEFPGIVTAGRDAKFGVPLEKIESVYRQAAEDGIHRFGLQCMTGSGILEPEYFVHLLTTILEVVKSLESSLSSPFGFVSMGGGFGIPYREEDRPLAPGELFPLLSTVFRKFYDEDDNGIPSLIVEPGKFLIGDAGFLRARVTGKKNAYKNFVGLDAGMNVLLRPALYRTYHRILKVGDPYASPVETVDFTGEICENTDRLAQDRPFPEVEEGDLVAIMDSGAYGFSMASQYNTRPRPAEVLLVDGEARVIRRRETIPDIFHLCDWEKPAPSTDSRG